VPVTHQDSVVRRPAATAAGKSCCAMSATGASVPPASTTARAVAATCVRKSPRRVQQAGSGLG
jgi:hypothetical protein